MAWGEKYKALLRDRFNVLGTVKIYKDGYSGVVTTLIGAGSTPLRFEFCNESDNVMAPFKSSRVVLTVWSFNMFALADLCSAGNMYHKVEIFHGENLYWSGYIDPHQCTEQYGPVPYPVNIYCIDGLTLLKTIHFDDDGEYYNGRRMESQIILDILGKIGITSFYESCNIYEDRMADSVDDSPFDQTFIDVDIFKDMYCYEVLVELLKKFNATIRQSYGAFYITRPTEMIGDSVAGRYFTGATTKNSVTIVPDQFIHRTATHPLRTIRQVPGGMKMIQPQVKEVITKQDYGNKESWLDNYQFKSKSYNTVTNKFDNWESGGAVLVSSVAYLIPGETEGCVFLSQDTYPEHNRHIYQEFGHGAMVTSDEFMLEFEFLFYNSGTELEHVFFYIEIKDSVGTRWLKNYVGQWYEAIPLDDCEWSNNQQYILNEADSPPGMTQWMTFKRKIPGLPVNGPYTIKIFSPWAHDPWIYIAIKNIKFYCHSFAISQMSEKMMVWKKRGWFLRTFTSYERKQVPFYQFPSEPSIVTTRDYVATNPINGEEVELDNILGDVVNSDIENVLEQFAGALAIGTAQIRIDTITLTGTYGQCALLCNGVGRFAIWNASPTQTAADFVTNYAALWLPTGVVLTSSGAAVIFTGTTAGFEFYGETSVGYQSGTLDGTVVYTTPAYALFPSESWSRRGESDMKQLLQIMCDEIADQYSRPKQLIQMPIMDTAGQMAINLLGNIQDTINTLDGMVRVFVINRGDFDVRNRIWNLDLFEIGTKTIAEEEPGGGPYTADNMVVTVDSTEITVDSG